MHVRFTRISNKHYPFLQDTDRFTWASLIRESTDPCIMIAREHHPNTRRTRHSTANSLRSSSTVHCSLASCALRSRSCARLPASLSSSSPSLKNHELCSRRHWSLQVEGHIVSDTVDSIVRTSRSLHRTCPPRTRTFPHDILRLDSIRTGTRTFLAMRRCSCHKRAAVGDSCRRVACCDAVLLIV